MKLRTRKRFHCILRGMATVLEIQPPARKPIVHAGAFRSGREALLADWRALCADGSRVGADFRNAVTK